MGNFIHAMEKKTIGTKVNFRLTIPLHGSIYETKMDGKERKNSMSGKRVSIVLKEDQRTGKLTEGIVCDILTKSPNHPHGIKVRLMSGEVGRVKEVF
jgi:uncharacterized repeat protein (TIGR03833 family)